MDGQFKDILLKILNAIDFSSDKDAFIKEFIELTQIEAFDALFKSLSPETQEKIQTEITQNANNPQKIQEIVGMYFSEELRAQTYANATQNAITNWMRAIEPTLSETQKAALVQIGQELQQQTPQQNQP